MAKRKAAVVQEPRLYLDLVTSSCCEETSEVDPDDRWSRASTATSWTVHGVRLVEQDGHQSLPVDFPVQVGDVVHVLYAVYSTGDTFGHDDGYSLEFLSVHKNYEVAQRNLASVEGRSRANSQYTMTLEFDSGGKVERHCPWDGFLESLDYVRLETFVVQGASFSTYPKRYGRY